MNKKKIQQRIEDNSFKIDTYSLGLLFVILTLFIFVLLNAHNINELEKDNDRMREIMSTIVCEDVPEYEIISVYEIEFSEEFYDINIVTSDYINHGEFIEKCYTLEEKMRCEIKQKVGTKLKCEFI